jgi:hypothetical protein
LALTIWPHDPGARRDPGADRLWDRSLDGYRTDLDELPDGWLPGE